MAKQTLDVLQIASPCEKSWQEMTGDTKSRFCDHCQKHVHNLSAMHRDDAERLLCESAGNLCVRFERTPAGRMITLDYQARPKRTRWLWPMLAITSITTAIAGAFMNPTTKPVMVMGAAPAMPASRPAIMMGTPMPIPFPPATQPDSDANAPAILLNNGATTQP